MSIMQVNVKIGRKYFVDILEIDVFALKISCKIYHIYLWRYIIRQRNSKDKTNLKYS